MYRIIITLLLILSLSSCMNIAKVGVEAIYLTNVVKSGQVASQIRTIEYSSTEQTIINHALGQATAFAEKYNISDPQDLLKLSSIELMEDYYNLRDSYIQVHKIVSSNSHKYDFVVLSRLRSHHRHASRLDIEVAELIKKKETYRALREIGLYSLTTLQILASLKP